MKDIKELIYAAVEENALKFQEIVNNQLQIRAYDAIEALRPEVGASMFGEAKKMEDDEEEMEDEDEDEDEDEMDDKKKSMKEALHPNQQKIDVVDDEKIDAKDFAKLRKTKNEETQKNIFRNPKLPAKDQLKNPPKQIKVEEVKNIFRNPKLPAKDQLKNPPKQIKVEEVEQIHEIGDTPRGKAALTKLASQRFGRARWAAGVHRATSRSDGGASPHSRLQDRDNAVAKKAADKAGIAHRDVPDHNYDFDKKGGVGTKVADPAHKLAARNKVSEEAVNEVAMPQNAADWQALITHQIKTTGHPVATDAQFRAPHGKDKTKIASLEPGEDKLQYATAQGGTVKQ